MVKTIPEDDKPKGPPKPKKKGKSRFSIPTNLDSVIVQQEEAAKNQDNSEEEAAPKFDESVTIDPEVFAKAYEELTEDFRKKERTSLVSMMGKNKYVLDHNRWIMIVHNEVSKKQLAQERDMVLFLRKKIGLPSLIMEIEIREIEINAQDKVPYTNEERLKILEQKNPKLKSFMQRFNTQIKY